ncbi:DUF6228 family protein [Streptomyces sp. NPDC006512]|uniref:DUF6228 family protein n=1 Tax=Streptomyces sp. NPDC006512 TaxID=3154307 RepID=UPI0033B49CCC
MRFFGLFAEDEYCVHDAVEAGAAGLSARLDGVTAWNRGADLAPFLEELSEDFRGDDLPGDAFPCTVPRSSPPARPFIDNPVVIVPRTIRP